MTKRFRIEGSKKVPLVKLPIGGKSFKFVTEEEKLRIINSRMMRKGKNERT